MVVMDSHASPHHRMRTIRENLMGAMEVAEIVLLRERKKREMLVGLGDGNRGEWAGAPGLNKGTRTPSPFFTRVIPHLRLTPGCPPPPPPPSANRRWVPAPPAGAAPRAQGGAGAGGAGGQATHQRGHGTERTGVNGNVNVNLGWGVGEI